jgi:hypothetical protein
VTSDADDRYSEEEVGLILRRAADAQPGRTLTLAELEAVATEAGLSAAMVRRAATDLRSRPEPTVAPPDGAFGPTMLVQERRVDGQLDASAWEELVAQIRRQLKVDGGVEHLGRELVWSSNGRSGRDIRVQVTPRRGQTAIRVQERTGRLAKQLFIGLMVGPLPLAIPMLVLICAEALGAPELIPIVLALWIYACYRFARTIYRTKLAARNFDLDALATGLADASDDLAALPPGKRGRSSDEP